MKAFPLLLVLFLSVTAVPGQRTHQWQRVYTFDDSLIDLNSQVVIGGNKIGRAKFRWTFNQPETLLGETRLKYKTRLETFEFDCPAHRYRPLEASFFDERGKRIRTTPMNPLGPWKSSEGMMLRMSQAVCTLVALDFRPSVDKEKVELEEAAKYVSSIYRRLEQTKDFGPIVEQYFARGFLKGYLQDQNTNWFFNLNRDTAARASLTDLQRFYVASMNVGYLSGLYFISQHGELSPASSWDTNLIPRDVRWQINNHAYSLKYRHGQGRYDFLAEPLDSMDRLRSYTDLIEGVAVLMREHVVSVKADRSKEYRELMSDSRGSSPVSTSTCPEVCFGLPAGSKLFTIQAPLVSFQLAKIRGKLQIVSASYPFR